MIEILKATYPSAKQWEMAIAGMRNPLNSWDRSDSFICYGESASEVEPTIELCENCPNSMYSLDDSYLEQLEELDIEDFEDAFEFAGCGLGPTPFLYGPQYRLREKDMKLAKNLINSGDEHAKFLRMLPVHIDIKAPLSWWKQFDTYNYVVKNSCSTMHKLTDKPFEASDFSLEYADDLFVDTYIGMLNDLRDRYLETKDSKYWYKVEELLLQSYNQLRTVSTNYAVLLKICAQRAGHKKGEWNDLIQWIVEEVPYFKELCYDKLCKISASFNERFGPNKEGK